MFEAIFTPIALPFGRILMFLYEHIGSYALSLILIAIFVRVILIPVQMKAKRGQLRQSRLNPKMDELKKKHAANKQKLNEETAKLFREEGINPAAGCLWGFIQMPIMIALFYAIRAPLTLMMGVAREYLEPDGAIYERLQTLNWEPTLTEFYIEVDQAQFIHANWNYFSDLAEYGLRNISFYLGPMNLAEIPDWQFIWTTDWSMSSIWLPALLLFLLPVLSGGVQFVAAAIMRKTNPMATPAEGSPGAGSMATVLKFMPLMSVFFGFILPAALSVFWTIGGVLQIAQDVILTKRYTRILDAEDAEKEKIRKEKEAVLEAKRLESERKKAEGITEENRNKSKRKKQKGDKQARLEKAAEWEKKTSPKKKDRDKDDKEEPSRVGNRRYARGRAYDPDRYSERFADSEIDDALDDDSLAVDADDSVDFVDTENAETDNFEDNGDFEEDYDDYEDDFDSEDDYEDYDDDEDDEDDDTDDDEDNGN